jgi:hypothetical protein
MRAIAGSWGAFAAYAATMIHFDRSVLATLLSRMLTTELFEATWIVVAVAMLAVVVTGWDWAARVAFALLGIGMAMGMASSALDRVPWERQWFAFGLMAVTFVQSLIVLLSPMRVPPRHLYQHRLS